MERYVCPETGSEAELVIIDGVYPECACSECEWQTIAARQNAETVFKREHVSVESEGESEDAVVL